MSPAHHARAATAAADDPLHAKYEVKRHHCLGSGTDCGVVRGVVRHGPEEGQWVALKYLSTKGHNPQSEVKILERIHHPHLLRLIESFTPFPPQRPQIVVVTAEADNDLRSYLGATCRIAGGQ